MTVNSTLKKWLKAIAWSAFAIVLVITIVGIYNGVTHNTNEQKAYWSKQQHLDGYVLNDSLDVIDNGNGISIINNVTNEVCAENIQFDWVQHSADSLSVFCSDGKRGFYNRYTGRIAIPAEYRRAWIFSDNLAAVQKNGYIGFINRRGEVVIPFKFPYHGNPLSKFVFSDGHCVVANEKGKCGVIDTLGNWLIQPIYKNINLQKEYAVVFNPGAAMQVDYQGRIINSFVVDQIEELFFTRMTVQIIEGMPQNVEQYISTGCFAYTIGGRVGLMNAQCKRLTEALYEQIEAKSATMFVATLIGYEGQVIIDNNGNVVR